ncbi:YcjF family protein [Aestuariibacter sp. A3R04]|uniref:YcjF family protein n=1 Tax=Aestuariibacter sp. A3R04 TaxID=2841571 RepID=UPI001C097E9B|nr:YcjF family protein [Aestuariibacter sp. A3R04]MBU3023762.1 DUF697 domain-containing protein [Aestuariibacter sp. A3R04]
MPSTEDKSPRYRSRITEVSLDQTAPKMSMPARLDDTEWDVEEQQGISLKAVTLMLGVLAVVAFMVFDAIEAIVTRFSAFPVSSTILGLLMGGFVVALLTLIVREWLGFRAVAACIETPLNFATLADMESAGEVTQIIDRHANRFGKGSYAARCYKQYQQMLTDDMTPKDITSLYEHTVAVPVTAKAEEIVKKEAVVSGSLTFISPNHLIQTLAISWISFRTIRRVARVFGLRPGTAGSWRLFKVLAQNLAAQSLFDMATDELANQIGGSLAAKIVENSAEAVAAGALNVRLGRTLIKLLR